MKTTVDTLQKSQAKLDELELKALSTANENSKLTRQLDNLNRGAILTLTKRKISAKRGVPGEGG